MDITKPCRDMSLLNPLAQKAFKLFLNECKKQGVKIFVTETIRTRDRQFYLLCQGRTVQQAKDMGVPLSFARTYANPNVNQVSWTLDSRHLKGLAIDIAVNPPNDLYDEKIIAKAGKIARELGIKWGADFGDNPHFEITSNWKEPKKEFDVDNQEKYLKQLLKNGTDGQKKWANDKLYLIDVYRNGTQGQKQWALNQLTK